MEIKYYLKRGSMITSYKFLLMLFFECAYEKQVFEDKVGQGDGKILIHISQDY